MTCTQILRPLRRRSGTPVAGRKQSVSTLDINCTDLRTFNVFVSKLKGSKKFVAIYRVSKLAQFYEIYRDPAVLNPQEIDSLNSSVIATFKWLTLDAQMPS